MVRPLATSARQNLQWIAGRSRTLPALGMDRPGHGGSSAQQADVAGALADRAFGALGVVLRGFEERLGARPAPSAPAYQVTVSFSVSVPVAGVPIVRLPPPGRLSQVTLPLAFLR